MIAAPDIAAPVVAARAVDAFLINRILRFGGPWLGVLVVVSAISTAAQLLVPITLGSAVDALLAGATDIGPLFVLGGLLAVVTASEVALLVVDAKVGAGTTRRLQRELLGHVLTLGLAAGRRFPVGDLVARATDSTQQTGQAGPKSLDVVFAGVTSVGALVALILVDPWSALAFCAGLPLMLVLANTVVRRTTALTIRYQEAHADLSSRLLDALLGARTIRASASADREVARILEPVATLRATGHEFWQTQRDVAWRMGVAAPLVMAAVLAAAGLSVSAGRIGAGQLLSVQLYAAFALPLFTLLGSLVDIGRVRGSARRLHDVLAEQPPPPRTCSLRAGDGGLSLRGVRVTGDDGAAVLDGVDLDIAAGTTVALVGTSGSGKSTLALVAGGALVPESGTVRLGDVDLATVDQGELTSAISFAFDRPFLLGDTVEEMIAYGDRPIPERAVQEALSTSRAAVFVARLPAGARTRLDGLELSGGELQRLGLARAACRTARLLVLDDALSSLDTVTEHDVVEAMDRTHRGVTRLVVAHREASAERADLVAWLDQGRIRALAPHWVLAQDPAYRAAFAMVEPGPTTLDVR